MATQIQRASAPRCTTLGMSARGRAKAAAAAAVPTEAPEGHAIPFIYPVPGDEDRFEVGAEALALLERISLPVAPIAICGRARSGKSFLLNCLLHERGGGGLFTVGNTVESCTRGMWLWSEPVPVEVDGGRMLALVIDTEGFGGMGATEEHDARIFALAALLSSLLVYNSVGAIDEDAVASLGFVAELTKHIRRSSDEGASADAVSKELSSMFPSFLWVLRDFNLELVDEEGSSMSARDYLEFSLEMRDGVVRAEDRSRDRVRRALTSYFRVRDCATLVRPASEEADLQDLASRPVSATWKALRPAFREGIADVASRVFGSLLSAKQVQGSALTGRALARLAVAYVGAINAHAVPTLGNAWADVARAESRRAARDATDAFRRALDALVERDGVLEEPVLDSRLQALLAGARAAFESAAVGDESLRRDARAEVEKVVVEATAATRASNAQRSQTLCQQVADRLLGELVERKRKDASKDGEDADVRAAMLALLDDFRRQYDGEARGPARLTLLARALQQLAAEVAAVLVRTSELGLERTMEDLQQRVAAAEEEAARLRARETELEAFTREATAGRQQALTQLAQFNGERAALRDVIDAAQSTERALRLEVEQLRAKATKQQAEIAQLRTKTSGLERDLASARDEADHAGLDAPDSRAPPIAPRGAERFARPVETHPPPQACCVVA